MHFIVDHPIHDTEDEGWAFSFKAEQEESFNGSAKGWPRLYLLCNNWKTTSTFRTLVNNQSVSRPDLAKVTEWSHLQTKAVIHTCSFESFKLRDQRLVVEKIDSSRWYPLSVVGNVGSPKTLFKLSVSLLFGTFAAGPSEIGNVVCQMENQT